MNALDKLVLLVPSLTKSEKRAFTLAQSHSDYYLLYQLILENQNISSDDIEKLYKDQRPGSNSNVTALYLYDKIIDTLCILDDRKNLSTQLLRKIQASRILALKAFYTDALEEIREVRDMSSKHKFYEIFLMASQAELDLLLKLDFVGMREEELAERHFEMEEAIKAIRKSEGLAALYDILKYRTYHYDIMRSEEQKNKLNDLLMSELSINSSIGEMNFEASKFHQLFQATYLMGVHDYTSALRALKELINLFKENPYVWENNQYYYIEAIETALKGLRCSKQYSAIEYFLSQLDEVDSKNKTITAYTNLLKLQYRVIPLIDTGEFEGAAIIVQDNKKQALVDLQNVHHNKQAELWLYTSVVEFGQKRFERVKEILSPLIFQSKHYSILPIMRTIRLIHLMAIYELGQIDDYDFELKSLKRSIGSDKKGYKAELLVIKYLQQPKLYQSKNNNDWKKWEKPILQIRSDVYERQLLKIFDFTKWVEAKAKNKKFFMVLKEGHEPTPQLTPEEL